MKKRTLRNPFVIYYTIATILGIVITRILHFYHCERRKMQNTDSNIDSDYSNDSISFDDHYDITSQTGKKESHSPTFLSVHHITNGILKKNGRQQKKKSFLG